MKAAAATTFKIQNLPFKSLIGALQSTFLARIIGSQSSDMWNVMKLFN